MTQSMVCELEQAAENEAILDRAASAKDRAMMEINQMGEGITDEQKIL